MAELNVTEITYNPIGIFKCSQLDPLESPRQGVLAGTSMGIIQLSLQLPFKSLQDLKGFDRVWLVYDFHLNKNWKPFVRPPRGSLTKRGVLSTRSPYRPNSIGLSCVRLGKVSAQQIEIFEHDLLDGTPILDIKPYLNYSDSFPEASLGWIDLKDPYPVHWTEQAAEQCQWLSDQLKKDVSLIVKRQLEFEPTDKKAKRVQKAFDHFIFSYKTWRFCFDFDHVQIKVLRVESGYSEDEINSEDDSYQDKNLHRNFRKAFL